MQSNSDRAFVAPAARQALSAQWQAALKRWLDDDAEPGPSETEQPPHPRTTPQERVT